MAIELVTKFAPYTDEIFHKESKKSLLTNNDFEWTGAHTRFTGCHDRGNDADERPQLHVCD